MEKKVRYSVMGEDGIYTFEATWGRLARDIGELTSLGFVLLGIDGLNGCNLGGTANA